MRPGGGKAKGASKEREVCKRLSLWLSKGEHEDLLWRSAMSGGRSTVGFAKGKRLAAQAGDISCIHPMGASFIAKFLVEVKDYADLQYKGLITGKGHLVEFWCETVVQARNYHKLPLLIAHQSRQPMIACVSQLGHMEFIASPVLIVPKLDLFILLFEDLLRDVPSFG